MAKLISVMAVSGRLAYTHPVGGRAIPHDRYITLPESAWLRSRLAAGDIEELRKTQTKRGRKKANESLPYETTEANPETIETA